MSRVPTLDAPRESSNSWSSEQPDAPPQELAAGQSRERGELSAQTDDCGLLLEALRAHRELHLSLVADAVREWEARETRRRGGASSRVGQ